MKKLIAVFILTLALAIFPAPAKAAESGTGGEQTGSILDYISLGGTGCGSSAANTPCSEDSSNGPFAAIACKVMKAFNAGVVPLYCHIVQNADYLAAIDAAMLLYVILMGFSFIFGLIPMRAGTLVGKLLKATIIYGIVINADLYFGLVYHTVLQIPQDAVRIMLGANTGAGSGTGSQNFFEYVDKAMHNIFNSMTQSSGAAGSGQTYNKTNLKIFMIGLAIWQLGGDLIGGIFFAVVVGWIVAYFSIMIRYLLAVLSMMFLLMLGPIFIPTLLFEQSKSLGEEWINMLISFILQIVLVVAFVLMVQGFFIEFYDMIKKGLESSAVMSESADKMLVTYNTDHTENNGAYGVTSHNNQLGSTPQDAEKYFQAAFGEDYKTKLPQMVFKLIEMWIIIMFSTMFLAVVPSLAAMLVGSARFVRMFQGINFGPRDNLYQANLLGQNQPKTMFDRFTTNDEARQLSGGGKGP